jgi:tetratricopeptide (TPR) repeat protein
MNTPGLLKDGKSRRELEKRLDGVLEKIKKNRRSSDYKAALSLFNEAAGIARALGDRRAIEYNVEYAKLSTKLNEHFNAGWAYRNAALISFELGEYSDTINYSQEALSLFIAINVKYGMQWCYDLMGKASERMKRPAAAIKFYSKSLEISRDSETECRIQDLSRSVPYVSISHTASSGHAKEGEEVVFTLSLKNPAKTYVRDIRILGKDSGVIASSDRIEPGDEKEFVKKICYSGKAYESPFSSVVWKTPDFEEVENRLPPLVVNPRPGVSLSVCINEKPRIGIQSQLVVSVKNNSKMPINEIYLSIDFPVELQVQPVTGYMIKKIKPGDEEGFVFRILPTIEGKIVLRPSITYKDDAGVQFEESMKPFFLEETGDIQRSNIRAEPPMEVDGKSMERAIEKQDDKIYVNSALSGKMLGEMQYMSIRKGMLSVSSGVVIKGVGLKTAALHVKEELKSIYMVSESRVGDDIVLLYSAESRKDGNAYLITFMIKETKEGVRIAMKMYSGREDRELAFKIMGIIKNAIISMNPESEIKKDV